jgi:hypothetical protein
VVLYPGGVPGVDATEVLLLAAAAVHAGFQVTVTVLVYPALLRAEPFVAAHQRHSRAIAPVVLVVYGALVLSGALRLVAGEVGLAGGVALAATATALLTTALVAAPTHGRLGDGRTDALARRLTRADLVRSLAALVALAGALVAALT